MDSSAATYDAAGRQIALRNELNFAVTLAYDAVGNRTTLRDATGTSKYAYTDRNELVSVESPSTTNRLPHGPNNPTDSVKS